MRIIPWVDPYTNKPLIESNGFLISENSRYQIIDDIPKFVKENSTDPQYKIVQCFSYQWTKSDFGQPEKFPDDYIKQDVVETLDLTD